MDIIVRKVNGKIQVVSGDSQLDTQLRTGAPVKVKLLATTYEVYVTRNSGGELVEVNQEESSCKSLRVPVDSIVANPLNERENDHKDTSVDNLAALNCPFCGLQPVHSVDSCEHTWIGGWSKDVKLTCCTEMTESFGDLQSGPTTEIEAKSALVKRWNTRAK